MKYYTRKVKKYAPGDVVFTENSECDGMYIVDKGRVRVYKTVVNAGKQQIIELCTLGPKSMFGEMAMIDESRRSASVQAIEPTECTIITKKIFEDQLAQIPPWMVNMIRILVQRIRETNDKLRVSIANHTPLPNDDTGSMLTVNASRDEPPPGSAVAVPARPAAAQQQAGVHPDDIIKDLFAK